MTHLIATLFYIGHMRPAPGTWGSAAAIPLAWGLHVLGGFPLLLIATVAVFLLGWWATAKETEGQQDHDPVSQLGVRVEEHRKLMRYDQRAVNQIRKAARTKK